MSKQLHRGEGDRRQQVKFRADERVVAEFDAFVEHSDEYDSRSEAMRALMRRCVGDTDVDAPREPPAEDELRTAYLTLVGLANYAGVVPHEIAVAELSTRLGKSQRVVERGVLHDLRRRGYLRQLCNAYQDRAWKLRGYE